MTPSEPAAAETSATETAARIDNLDTIRGVAVLGILLMNIVSFGLGSAAYFNLDAGGSRTITDWTVGVIGEVFVDQKFMAIFSLLFGAGVVLFAERTESKGKHPVRLSLWRNLLLLLVGGLHTLLWDGDVLMVYALSIPVLLMLRRRSPRALAVLGVAIFLIPSVIAPLAQSSLGVAGPGGYWVADTPFPDLVGAWVILDVFSRAIGMMLIGMAMYRTGLAQGDRPSSTYRRIASIGLAIGVPLAAAGVIWQAATGFDADIAIVSTIPNSLGTMPLALGIVALITLWNAKPDTALHRRVRAVGRMALTNYLAQTVLGLGLAAGVFGGDLGRTGLLAVVVAIWALQLLWSPWWLDRFRYGPVEWAWRSATHRRRQPMRRTRRAAAAPTDANRASVPTR